MSLGRRSLLTKILGAGGNIALCLHCRGKGFAPDDDPRGRAARRCPKCKGAGRIEVGSTKR